VTARTLTPVATTPAAFAPFGEVIACGVDAPAGALRLDGGDARLWVMAVRDRPLVDGAFPVESITRHRRVTQCLASADGEPWFLAVAPPDADPSTDPDCVTAFVVPRGTALLLHVGTWHAGPFSRTDGARFFNLELVDTNDVDHDTVSLASPVRVSLDGRVAEDAERRVLVVANRTTTSPELLATLQRLAASGATQFRVVVPASHPSGAVHAIP
jgi:ureidoglycolate lyase